MFLHIFTKLCSQTLDYLYHFHQTHVCIFLSITGAFICLNSFSLISFSNFCVFCKFLEFFNEVYDYCLKFCVLGSLKVIIISKHFYQTGRLWREKYWLDLSCCLYIWDEIYTFWLHLFVCFSSFLKIYLLICLFIYL